MIFAVSSRGAKRAQGKRSEPGDGESPKTLTLPAVLSDRMVLQRQKPIAVWGHAPAGQKVEVVLGNGKAESVANQEGSWSVRLPGMEAGGPHIMQIKTDRTIRIKDILIGEVWLCSGQSNMEWSLKDSKDGPKDIRESHFPNIRLFTSEARDAATPKTDTGGEWLACSPDSVPNFSGVGFYFGRELYQELNIPIGLIHSSWGGALAEAWTPREILENHKELQPIVDRWAQKYPDDLEKGDEGVTVNLEIDEIHFVRKDGSTELLDDFSGPDKNRFGGSWWSQEGKASKNVSYLAKNGHGLFSAWLGAKGTASLQVGLTSGKGSHDLSEFESVRLRMKSNHGIIMHLNSVPNLAGTIHWAWIPNTKGEWKTVELSLRGFQIWWGPPDPLSLDKISGLGFQCGHIAQDQRPSGLYNAMIHPLVPFSMRGAIWYQGEGNAGRGYQYRYLLGSLAQSWKNLWSDEDFKFIVVQLPGFGPIENKPKDSNWAELRESQLHILGESIDGLAVTLDVGDADDVHPTDKEPVGHRLALIARAKVYGEDIVCSGPVYRSHSIESNKMTLTFDHVHGGLAAYGGKELAGFEIAGEDKKFEWAKANIDGDNVIVSSPKVEKPVAVRYAWADTPKFSLINKEGLLASPFRTDDWPGLTNNLR